MMPGSADAAQDEFRRANSAACLVAFRRLGTATIAEVSGATGLSRPTVSAAVEDWAERGLLETVAVEGKAVAGRPAARYRFVPDAGFVLAFHEAAMHRAMLLVDLTGTVRHFAIHETFSERLQGMGRSIDAFLAEAGVPRERVGVTACAISGIVERTGVLSRSELLPECQGINIAEHLHAITGGPAVVENDVNLSALAEQCEGSAVGAADVLYVRLDAKVNTGLIIDGNLHRGFHAAAGEVADVAGVDITMGMDPAPESLGRSAQTLSALGAAIDPEVLVIGITPNTERVVSLAAVERALLETWAPVNRPRILQAMLGEVAPVIGAVRAGFLHLNAEVFGSSRIPAPGVSELVTVRDWFNERIAGITVRRQRPVEDLEFVLIGDDPGGVVTASLQGHPLGGPVRRNAAEIGSAGATVICGDWPDAATAGAFEAPTTVYVVGALAQTIVAAEHRLEARRRTGAPTHFAGPRSLHARAVRELIDRERLSTVRSVTIRRAYSASPEPGEALIATRAGVADLGAIQWLAGSRVAQVAAAAPIRGAMGTPVVATLLLSLASGAVASYEVTWGAVRESSSLTLIAANGQVEAAAMETRLWLPGRAEATVAPIFQDPMGSLPGVDTPFLEALRLGRGGSGDVELAWNSVAAAAAAETALTEGTATTRDLPQSLGMYFQSLQS